MHTMPDAILSINNDEYPISYLFIGSSILFLYIIQLITPLISNKLLYISDYENNNNIIKLSAFWTSILIHGIFEGFSAGTLKTSINSTILMIGLFIHKTIEYLILVANIPCVICFIFSYWYSKNYDDIIGIFSALTSGTFLYLSLSHIIPESINDNDYCLCDNFREAWN